MSDVDQLSPGLRQELAPLLERWSVFVGKITARVEQAAAEADAGLDQIIEEHATDYGPMGAAMGAIRARFHGLDQKLQEAQQKIEDTLWEVCFRDDLGADSAVVNRIRDAFLKDVARVHENISMRGSLLETSKSAAWARKVAELAKAEIAQGAKCSVCGGPFALEVYWKSTNQACPHCGAMVSLSPGPAASMLYQGNGVESLAREAAIEEWKSDQHADKAYRALRHPTDSDRQVRLAAARAYWTKFYETVKALHPGFSGTVEDSVAMRLRQYDFWDAGADKQSRAYLDQVVAAATARDAGRLRQLMAGERPASVWGLDDICEALAERGDIDGTRLALGIRYDLENETDPRDAWIAEELRDVLRTVRNRT